MARFYIGANQVKLKVITIFLLATLVASCAQNTDQETCELSKRWNVSSTQISLLLNDIESADSGLIQSVFVDAVSILISLNESAARNIKSDTELILNTYGALSDAFENVDWQGALSQKDSAVASAAVRLASDDLQQAQTNLANYISENCNLQLDNAINKFPNSGTTLPDPLIKDEASPEPPVGFDSDTSLARAFGFVVVERFGVAVTDQQADCVGTALLEATAGDTQVVDESYWQMLQGFFDSCDIKIDIAKSLENE